MSSDLHTCGVAELGRRLKAREVSAVELATAARQRILAHPGLGTFLALDEDTTLAQARVADGRLQAGDSSPLLGVPLAHKDIFVTRGWPTTAGSKMLAGYASPFDATVVARLAQAGAVTLGKLNCDEFAMGSSNENSAFAPVLNPWDTGSRAGRFVGWLGRGRGGAPAAGHHRHRHRWLDPPAGQLLRHHRHQADLWRVLTLRHGGLCLQPRSGRPAGAQRRRLRAAAVGDERFRRA
jgi:hypothetical protein